MDKKRLKERFVNNEPFAQLLKLKLLDLSEGSAKMELPIAPYLLNKNGVVMGGAIVSLADFAAPYAAMTLISKDEELATISATINFLRPVVPQDRSLAAIALAQKPRFEKDDKERNRKLIDVEVKILSAETGSSKALYKATLIILDKLVMKKILALER